MKTVYKVFAVVALVILCFSCKKTEPTTLTLSKNISTVQVGKNDTIAVTATPVIEGVSVTVESSNEEIATAKIAAGKCIITGASRGLATVTVAYNGLTAVVNVNVFNQDQVEKRWPDELNTTMGKFIKIQRDSVNAFQMGSTDGETDEQPVHGVILSKSFYMAEFELTQELWESVMGSNPSVDVNPKYPVNNVSITNVQSFIANLNKATGRSFRLPTEAEWEFAAKGGVKSNGYKYSGSNNLDDVAWFDDNAGDLPREVGKKQPNELGLYDMSGNIQELCSDKYAAYKEGTVTDPAATTGSRYNARGGKFDDPASSCTNTFRKNCVSSTDKFYNLGFRLVISEPLESELK